MTFSISIKIQDGRPNSEKSKFFSDATGEVVSILGPGVSISTIIQDGDPHSAPHLL